MRLSLSITSYQRLTPGQQEVFHPDNDSFTIGRNNENDWAIPDPQRFLSGVHCRIHKEGESYEITDTSTNGVFLNGSEQRLTRNESVTINTGDKFRIGDYEFEILIEDESLSGNPVTADEETMTGADPFDDPVAKPEVPLTPDDHPEPDPFADNDPFSETDSYSSSNEMEDEFLKDMNTPLSQLDDSPMGRGMSIDSLMGFADDNDNPDELDSADKLEQDRTPLREAFKSSAVNIPSTPVAPPPPPTRQEPEDAVADEFPDNWDEATGMFKVPDGDDLFATSDSTEFPDNWDEATGMFVEPLQPPPAKTPPPKVTAPKPPREKSKRPAPPRVKEGKPASPVVTVPSGDAMAAFASGAGLQLDQISGIDQSVLFEQVGRMLIMFTEGLIQTLGGRTHIKSEFRLDQTMIRPAENNPFKFSTSKTRTLMQLLSKSDPAYLTGVNAISEGFDDVNAHQMAVVAGMEAALQDILGRFDPKALENRMVSDSVLDNILPGGKKAKYWDIFKLLFNEIAGEAEDTFQELFGKECSRAYEDQLDRLKNTRKE